MAAFFNRLWPCLEGTEGTCLAKNNRITSEKQKHTYKNYGKNKAPLQKHWFGEHRLYVLCIQRRTTLTFSVSRAELDLHCLYSVLDCT